MYNKYKTFLDWSYTLCDSLVEENIFHSVMQYEANCEMGGKTFAEIEECSSIVYIKCKAQPLRSFIYVPLGKTVERFSFSEMSYFFNLL